MVCTVYIGNIHNRSRFSLKVNTVEARYPRACGGKDKLNRIVEVSILFPYLLLNTVFSVRSNQCGELELIVNVGFGDIRFPPKDQQKGEAVHE